MTETENHVARDIAAPVGIAGAYGAATTTQAITDAHHAIKAGRMAPPASGTFHGMVEDILNKNESRVQDKRIKKNDAHLKRYEAKLQGEARAELAAKRAEMLSNGGSIGATEKAALEAHERKLTQDVSDKVAKRSAEVAKNGIQRSTLRVAAADGAKTAGKSVGKMLLRGAAMRSLMGPLAVAATAADVVDIFRHAAELLHKAPTAPRTYFLPVSGNGRVDNPHGRNDVSELDKVIAQANMASFAFEPAVFWQYCEEPGCTEGCGEGCTARPVEMDAAPLVAAITAWHDRLGTLPQELTRFQGDNMTDRILEAYDGDLLKLDALKDSTETVVEKTSAAANASNDMSAKGWRALRDLNRAGREEMQRRANDDADSYGWLDDGIRQTRGNGSVEKLQQSKAQVEAAAKENDGAIAALTDALKEWTFGGAMVDGNAPSKASDAKTVTLGGAPSDGGTGGGELLKDAPSTPSTPETPTTPSTPADPGLGGLGDPGLGGGGGTPDLGGGGIPSGGGGDPMSGLGGGGAPTDSGIPDDLGGVPMDEELDAPDPDADANTDENTDGDPDDTTDDKEAETDPDAEDNTDDNTDDPDDESKDGEDENLADGELPPVDGANPTEQGSAVTDPTLARTVDVNGQPVLFADERMANVARSILASEDGNPKSITTAMSDAGMTPPPIGEDLGDRVPPTTAAVGDMVSTADGKHGIVVGDGQVLMEDKSVQSLDEMDLSGAHNGIFRAPMDGTPGGDTPIPSAETAHAPTAPTVEESAPVGAQDAAVPSAGDDNFEMNGDF